MDWDDFDDDEEPVDCRHGCNGDCVVLGYDNGVCGISCHPGLHYSPEAAERVALKMDEMCCYPDLPCSVTPDADLEGLSRSAAE
jgi:hypothetical protein